MTAKYRPAPEVAAIAAELIEEHHRQLIGWRIEYLFRDKAATSGGVTVLGRARLVKGLNAFLARTNTIIDSDTGEVLSLPVDADKPIEPAPFFVIEIALDCWGDNDEDGVRWGLDDDQRIALVDHELCHLDVDADGKPHTRPHSIEEFTEIVERHGLWKSDVRRFVESANGVRSLPLEDDR